MMNKSNVSIGTESNYSSDSGYNNNANNNNGNYLINHLLPNSLKNGLSNFTPKMQSMNDSFDVIKYSLIA